MTTKEFTEEDFTDGELFILKWMVKQGHVLADTLYDGGAYQTDRNDLFNVLEKLGIYEITKD